MKVFSVQYKNSFEMWNTLNAGLLFATEAEALLYIERRKVGRKTEYRVREIQVTGSPEADLKAREAYTGSDDGREAEALLEAAAEAQTAYWDALRKLEEALDIEIESGRDLRNATIEILLEVAEDNRTPTCRHAKGEDCLICAKCGKCDETLDDEDICDTCRK